MMANNLTYERFMDLTNDKDKVKLILQHLSELKNWEPVNIHQEFKSAKKATKYIEEGNKNFPTKPWKSVLKTYTQAVVYAPPNSNELARAYGNRSAALFEGKLYKDSILDIERALNIGYPDDTKTKLYVRKARCLLALNNEMSPEVKEALAEARNWLAKMDDANKKYMSDVLSKVSINPVCKKSLEFDGQKFLPQAVNENPKIMGASAVIEIKYSKKFGRHIVATRDIACGETLLVHKAYATVLEECYLLKFCWNCASQVWAGVPCNKCVAVIYCSESCRDIGWHDYHDIECPVISAVLRLDMRRRLMVLRLTAKACKEAGGIEKLREKLIKIDAIHDPIMKSYSENIYDHTKYASVYTLLKGRPISFEETIKCMYLLYYLTARTDILGKRITSFCNLLNNPSAIFIGELMLRHYQICLMNCSSTTVFDDHYQLDAYGYSMNPLINLFNHSCDPTACVIGGGDVRAVVAIGRIKKGAQIHITYGPLFWEDSIHERRRTLEPYRFVCECSACVEYWGPHSLLSFPSHKLSSTEAESKLFKKCQRLTDITASMLPIAEIHSLITVMSDLMNVNQRNTKYLTQEIVELKRVAIPLYAHMCSKLVTKST